MTMHMCGPALSLNGKKKGRFKYRNAAEAQKARELEADWKELLKRQVWKQKPGSVVVL